MNTAYTPAIRAIIQIVAGILAKHGYDVGNDVEPIAAGAIAVASLVWSVIEKNKIKNSATN